MNDEVNLTLADVEDDTSFDELYDEWDIKDRIPLRDKDLRAICHLWYGRGVARGTEWAAREIDRLKGEQETQPSG